MKTIVTTSPNIESAGMTVTEMGVSAKRVQKILGYMRDNIYSDKVLAVVREYSANGLDEHKKFGIKRPVSIGIRESDEGHSFFVRDYAKGLSDDGVRNVFAMSGESTKDNSDDEIGGFGIGAKCGLSYADSFFVHSYFGGQKTTYSFALGANSIGDTVGLVYDLGKSPTTETGIEIEVPIKREDIRTFWNRIKGFVSLSPHEIEAEWNGTLRPAKTVWSHKEGGFSFRCVKLDEDCLSSERLVIQMGGLTYLRKGYNFGGKQIKEGHALVVDMPIGKCVPALSRETLENSERTDNAVKEIHSICEKLAEEDMSQFKTKTLLDIIKDRDSLGGMRKYQGSIFEAYISQLYDKWWRFSSQLNTCGDYTVTTKSVDKNGKLLCVVIPNNMAHSYWSNKVGQFLVNQKVCYYKIMEDSFWMSDPDLMGEAEKYFRFIEAKKLPYPKQASTGGGGRGKYVIYRRCRSVDAVNAKEFFDLVKGENDWKTSAATPAEAKKFIESEIKKAENVRGLYPFMVRTTQGGKDTEFFVTNSAKFVAELKKWGFIDAASAEYRTIREKVQQKESEKVKNDAVISSAVKSWFEFAPASKKRVNNLRNAKRVSEFWLNIRKESSLRRKIIDTFESRSYYTSHKLSRAELRKILVLK